MYRQIKFSQMPLLNLKHCSQTNILLSSYGLIFIVFVPDLNRKQYLYLYLQSSSFDLNLFEIYLLHPSTLCLESQLKLHYPQIIFINTLFSSLKLLYFLKILYYLFLIISQYEILFLLVFQCFTFCITRLICNQ